MIDMERIIKGLESCRKTDCINCPYSALDTEVCLIKYLLDDALSMVKEQAEEISCLKKKYLEHVTTVDLEGDPHNGYWYVCEECHGPVSWHEPICPHCKWRLDWNG